MSAVVVSYNRAAIIGTCLRALGFADEVIVVDKSSTDGTAEIAVRHADRVVSVPWTPAVEDTRAFAVAQCSGDWILCLDDDECLGPGAGQTIHTELAAPRADIYFLPLRHYILGVHDEAAYYWPEHHPRLFRRDAVSFSPTVHGGIRLRSDRTWQFPSEGGVVIHHLSHRDVREWIDKCNRYTSNPDRQRAPHDGRDLAAFAHARIDHWLARTRNPTPGDYPQAVAVLRAVYDIVDRLKTREEESGIDGATEFARLCAALDAEYAACLGPTARVGTIAAATPATPDCDEAAAQTALRTRIAELRECCDAAAADARHWAKEADQRAAEVEHLSAEASRRVQEAADRARDAEHRAKEAEAKTDALEERTAEAARLAAETGRLLHELTIAVHQRDRTAQALEAAQQRLAAIETSTCWRATAGARRLADSARRLAGRG